MKTARQAIFLALLCTLPATHVYAAEESFLLAPKHVAEAGPSRAPGAEVDNKEPGAKRGKAARQTTTKTSARWTKEEEVAALKAAIQYGSRHVNTIAGRTPNAVYTRILALAKQYNFKNPEQFLDAHAATIAGPGGQIFLSERQQEIFTRLRYKPTSAGVRGAAFMLGWPPELCTREVAEVLKTTQSATILEALRKLKGWGLLREEGLAPGRGAPGIMPRPSEVSVIRYAGAGGRAQTSGTHPMEEH